MRYTSEDIQALIDKTREQSETIKGLDRRNAEYMQEVARLNKRIASLLEAQVSVPTRDVNGTIEAQQSLIRKLKGDVLTLQRKVNEQDERLAGWEVWQDEWMKENAERLNAGLPIEQTRKQPSAVSGSEVVDILIDALDGRTRGVSEMQGAVDMLAHEQMK